MASRRQSRHREATYVALAEKLACVLITVDARLARANGPRCSITVLEL